MRTKIYLFTLACSFLLSMASMADGYCDASPYMEVEVFFRDFYRKYFMNSNDTKLRDNGYMKSMLVVYDKKDFAEQMKISPIAKKAPMKKAIIDNLLSIFAYAKPSDTQKSLLSEVIIDFLSRGMWNTFDLYSVPRSSIGGMEIELTQSCGMNGPDNLLLLVDKEQAKSDNELLIAYAISSDVCD